MFKTVAQYVSTVLNLKTSDCLANVSVINNKTKKEETVVNDIPFSSYKELETALIANKILQASALLKAADIKRAGSFNKFITSKLVPHTLTINEIAIPHDQKVTKHKVGSIKIEVPPYSVTITLFWGK